jgi:4-diphosphocytidyl-2-C-methyl-D-erythritol kinase
MSDQAPEGRRWTGEAPAKVNLFLKVLEQEPSGFHRIETVFQALELSDGVAIEVIEDEGEQGVEGAGEGGPADVELLVKGVTAGELGPPETNLAYRAASRFQELMHYRGLTPPAFRIVLEKRIPHGAGLGGGSSDAAAVLLGVNSLAGDPFSQEDLLQIGAKLGSDIPFFLTGAARAAGTGRGEVLTPLSPLPQREVLLLVPSEGIATGWAYGILADERERTATTAPSPEATDALLDGSDLLEEADWDEFAAVATNDFESVLFPLRQELEMLKELLVRSGADLALLSGSGSVVFGVFSNAAALESAAQEAERVGVGFIRTRTRAESP